MKIYEVTIDDPYLRSTAYFIVQAKDEQQAIDKVLANFPLSAYSQEVTEFSAKEIDLNRVYFVTEA